MSNSYLMGIIVAAAIIIGLLLVAGLLIWLALRNRTGRNDPSSAGITAEEVRPVTLFIDPTNEHLVVKRSGRFLASSYGLPPEEKEEMVRMAECWLIWLGAKPGAEGQPLMVRPVAAAGPAEARPAGGQAPAGSAEGGSIVSQINAVVQDLLADSPYADRAIQLTERPGCSGVDVWIGSQRYEGVEEVTDPEIRAFLQEAVKTWEERAEQ